MIIASEINFIGILYTLLTKNKIPYQIIYKPKFYKIFVSFELYRFKIYSILEMNNVGDIKWKK